MYITVEWNEDDNLFIKGPAPFCSIAFHKFRDILCPIRRQFVMMANPQTPFVKDFVI